ncbi:unnamed protein product [Symbiodinium microadriaticum]|nr:unnamed protein product [Symbiodinium microadriaticum]
MQVLGVQLFRKVRWHVADNDAKDYASKGVEVSQILECGPVHNAQNAALRLACRTGRPVIVIPDDVSGFSICDGSLDWEGGHGRPLLPDKFAKVLLKALLETGCCFGGPYVCPNAVFRYQMPLMSFTNFVAGDVWMVLPSTLPDSVHFRSEACPKQDYDFCAQLLRGGMPVLRLNRLGATCGHKQKGGAGKGEKRWKQDVSAAKWLIKTWPGSFQHKKNPQAVLGGAGKVIDAEILFTGGQSLIEAADARLMGEDGTLRNLIDLMASTKVSKEQSLEIQGRGRKKAEQNKDFSRACGGNLEIASETLLKQLRGHLQKFAQG